MTACARDSTLANSPWCSKNNVCAFGAGREHGGVIERVGDSVSTENAQIINNVSYTINFPKMLCLIIAIPLASMTLSRHCAPALTSHAVPKFLSAAVKASVEELASGILFLTSSPSSRPAPLRAVALESPPTYC